MKHSKKRGILAALGAMATAVTLALGGSVAANAQSQPVPESSQVTITKIAQPDTLGDPATGLEQDVAGNGIGGVVFDYYLVTETGLGGANDIGTNQGQSFAAGLTAADAPIGDEPTGSFPATQTPSGVTTATLPRGLYVIQEDPATVPAGVTAAAPFLLSVPLTDPENLDAWLDHIYVYPKNSQISGEKTVVNSGADQLTVGSDVTWTITADIPRVENPAGTPAFIAPDLFRIDDTLQDDQLAYVGAVVTAGAGSPLTEDEDFTVTPVPSDPAGSTTYQILFTEQGREALAEAVNADSAAQVSVELTTTVLTAAVIENSANVYPNQDSVTEDNPLMIPGTDVRYGSVNFAKLSGSDAITDLSGAVFELYTTRAAAEGLDQAARVTPTDNAGDVQGQWTSDAEGKFSIEGLRFSGYADGESFDDTDERYQSYWLVEVTALDGHQLLAEPLEITVTGDADGDGFEIVNQPNEGGFELPLTGGTGTAIFTIGGILILGAVLFLVVRSRRREAASAE